MLKKVVPLQVSDALGRSEAAPLDFEKLVQQRDQLSQAEYVG